MSSPLHGIQLAPRMAILAFGLALGSAAWAEEPAPKDDFAPVAGPRVVVRLTSALFEPIVDKNIDKTTPVVDVVLGTPVRGTSRTIGRPQLSLVDDDRRAAFVVTLTGTTTSHTTGQKGPAIVRTRADSSFTATKRVAFVAGSGFQSEPAQITVNTRVQNQGIEPTRRGVFGVIGRAIERRGQEQFAAQRAQVTAIARQRAEARITRAFDQVLNDRLAELNRNVGVRQAMIALAGFGGDTVYTCRTCNDCVEIAMTLRGGPTTVELPIVKHKLAPVQIWMHQSLLGQDGAAALKQFDQLREGGSFAARALDALPPLLKPDLGLLQKQAEKGPRIDYLSADDWMVVHMDVDPERIADGVEARWKKR